MKIEAVTITIPADDLLRAIWFSDGSGVKGGMPLDSLPTEYRVVGADMQFGVEPLVRLTLERVEPAP